MVMRFHVRSLAILAFVCGCLPSDGSRQGCSDITKYESTTADVLQIITSGHCDELGFYKDRWGRRLEPVGTGGSGVFKSLGHDECDDADDILIDYSEHHTSIKWSYNGRIYEYGEDY